MVFAEFQKEHTPGGGAGQCSHTTLKQAATEVHVSAFHQPILPLPLTTAHCVLQKLPDGDKHKEYFSLFQITTRETTNYITTTTQNTTLGVYVDTRDGWKVKLTKKQEYWDKFRIAGFKPPATDPSPVQWEPVCNLQQSQHIKYRELIMRERTPALFPDWEDCGLYFVSTHHTIAGYS